MISRKRWRSPSFKQTLMRSTRTGEKQLKHSSKAYELNQASKEPCTHKKVFFYFLFLLLQYTVCVCVCVKLLGAPRGHKWSDTEASHTCNTAWLTPIYTYLHKTQQFNLTCSRADVHSTYTNTSYGKSMQHALQVYTSLLSWLSSLPVLSLSGLGAGSLKSWSVLLLKEDMKQPSYHGGLSWPTALRKYTST